MKRVLVGLGIVVLIATGALAAFVLVRRHEGRDIRGSSVEFTMSTEAAAPPPPRPTPRAIPWPTYGRTADRTREVAGLGLRPPFRKLWTWRGESLVEFPPAIAYDRLYVATNEGKFASLSTSTGRAAWKFFSHRCVAASPAVHDGVVFEAFLNHPPCNASGGSGVDGEVIAFGAGFGRIQWRRTIGPSETSPLVAGGLVYVGDWRGNVYALDEHTGAIRWTFHTGGAVKGAVALAGGRLYAGSYDGHVYALSPRTGKEIWRASVQPRLGASGRFYSTPAVAYGRVYIGSTDGKVYSYGAASGKLRWSHSTGGYVYASPAIWHGLVLVGSYGGTFYAFDAETGDTRWEFEANGAISGSATVIDGVVYVATLSGRTYALAAGSGKLLWTYPDGRYTPAVAEQGRLFLVGYTKIYGLVPR